MFSHMTIGTRDLARAVAFYDLVLTPLGIERLPGKFPSWASWQELCATSSPLPWESLRCWLLPRWPFNL